MTTPRSTPTFSIELPEAEAEDLLASLDAVFLALDRTRILAADLELAVESFRRLRFLVYCALSAPKVAA